MDSLASLPIIGLFIAYSVMAWLLTHGIRRVIRLQFRRLHRRLDRNEAAKFLLPLLVGSTCAALTPDLIFGWFGVMFPDDATLYVKLWSKIMVGGGAGLASALVYKTVRARIRARLAAPAPAPSDDVPPDADRP